MHETDLVTRGWSMVSMIMSLFNGDVFLMNVLVFFFCSQQDLVGTHWINVYFRHLQLGPVQASHFT